MESEEYFLEKLNFISSIMKVALDCTRELPRKRSNIQDVLLALTQNQTSAHSPVFRAVLKVHVLSEIYGVPKSSVNYLIGHSDAVK